MKNLKPKVIDVTKKNYSNNIFGGAKKRPE
jgi:hypothetical protein